MAGRLPDAATANASATRKATLRFWAKIDSTIAMAPMTTAAIRATRTSDPSSTSPLRMTLA